jgi:hypothetical protein
MFESTEKSSQTENKAPAVHLTGKEIELRAYQIYLERGGADGHDVDDWLQAEREQAERELLFEKYANIGRIAKGVGA